MRIGEVGKGRRPWPPFDCDRLQHWFVSDLRLCPVFTVTPTATGRCMQVVWQNHKNQLGREAGTDGSLMRISRAYRDVTADHFTLYAAITLEELAVETGEPAVHLNRDVRRAFRKLGHKLVRYYVKPLHTSRSQAVADPVHEQCTFHVHSNTVFSFSLCHDGHMTQVRGSATVYYVRPSLVCAVAKYRAGVAGGGSCHTGRRLPPPSGIPHNSHS